MTASASAPSQPSAQYWSDLQNLFALNAEERATKYAQRRAHKAAATRVETAIWKNFTPLERSEFLARCWARYTSLSLPGVSWAAVLALDERDFAGPLFEAQQVEFLKERAKVLAPLEALFEE